MKTVVIALLVCLPFVGACQSLKVIYDNVSGGKTNKMVLEANDSISTFDLIAKTDPSFFFLKMKDEGHCYTANRITTTRFHVKDSLHPMQWKLGSDTVRLLNQLCLSAKTMFRGRQYTAYYAPGVPISDGPWKFGGLPGLILWLKSDDNYAEWKAIEITQNVARKINTSAILAQTFLEWDSFVAAYKDAIAKFIKLVRSNGTLTAGDTAQLKIESLEIFYPELQAGNGITY